MLSSLPDRPLTDDEANRLKRQDRRIVPLSVLKGGENPYVIYTLAFYDDGAGRVHLLGYADDEGGWVNFESFPENDWTVDKQETAVQNWVNDQYGDEFEQGMLDEESKTVDMGL